MNRKEKRTYYFSVEGECEKWYLEWLQTEINKNDNSKYTVKFISKVQKDPLTFVKQLNIVSKTKITHFFDVESLESDHIERFKDTLKKMKKAQSYGKSVKYYLGYSNFTFDLWVVLHKVDCFGSLPHRNKYLRYINSAYNEKFENHEQYTQENNFKHVLSQLSIENVCEAIERSKLIMKRNHDNGYVLHNEYGFNYYSENPSLSVWECIEEILVDCGLNEL